MQWIWSHPGKFLQLSAERARYFWFPIDLERRYRYPIWAATLVGFAALLWMLVRGEPAWLPIATSMFSYSVVYYVVQTDFRYRFPIYTFSLLLAAYAIWSVYLAVVRYVAARPQRCVLRADYN
jgi:hypothetical protein